MKTVDFTIRDYFDGILKTEGLDFVHVRERLQQDQILRLLHATLGLGSEVAELVAAIDRYPHDVMEIIGECGDVFWYAGVACDSLGKIIGESGGNVYRNPWTVFGCDQCMISRDQSSNAWRNIAVRHINNLLFLCEEIQTGLKAYLFYGREVDWNYLELSVGDIVVNIIYVAAIYGFSKGDVMRANSEKLLNKKSGRYKDGKFSEEAANDRNTAAEFAVMEK